MNKKIFALVALSCVLSVAAFGEEIIGGFWGVDFGSGYSEAVTQMTKNNAVPIFDSYDFRLGRTALWRGTFAEKLCLTQMWFARRGMWRAQVSFKETGDVAAQLTALLTKKYGEPTKNGFSNGHSLSWKTFTKTLDLTTVPGAGTSGYDTVLTYTDRARMPK